MSKEIEKSLGDKHTLPGTRLIKSAEQSLGDRSTFGDGGGSSIEELPGLSSDADLDIEIVDLSNRYHVEGVLGKGGMGEVLLATDSRLERKVAIKRIRGDFKQSRTAVSRILTEGKLIAALNHTNIVQIYDYGCDKDGPFLVMEHVDGGSLLDRCRQGAMPLEEAVELVCHICDGLAKAHEAGIIHRDIKPANILIKKDGVPKLTDFGLAKAKTETSSMTKTGAVLGTLDFMPPEQRRDAMLADARSDLWSLAATLYQMVTGESPKVIRIKKVPAQLQDVLDKALEESKENRFQGAGEFKAALRASLQQQNSLGSISSVITGTGICLKCKSQNDPSRKFCKECATPLRASCLACRVEIPIWDRICAKCGAEQQQLIAERNLAYERMKLAAEAKLEACEFGVSRKIAESLSSELDVRFQQHAAWGKQFLAGFETKKAERVSRVSELLFEALQHENARDYTAAVHALNQFPPTLLGSVIRGQSTTAAALLKRIEAKQAEIRQLEKTIRLAISKKQFDGLLEKVNRLLTLQPDRQDVHKLRDTLLKRNTQLNPGSAESRPNESGGGGPDCPHCKHEVQIEDNNEGNTVKCQKCRSHLRLTSDRKRLEVVSNTSTTLQSNQHSVLVWPFRRWAKYKDLAAFSRRPTLLRYGALALILAVTFAVGLFAMRTFRGISGNTPGPLTEEHLQSTPFDLERNLTDPIGVPQLSNDTPAASSDAKRVFTQQQNEREAKDIFDKVDIRP